MTKKDIKLDNIEAVLKKEEISLNIHGFYTHAVFPCEHHPDAVRNIHTHGLPKSRNHKDIQIALPIDPMILHKLIWSIVEFIDKGNKCIPGKRCSEMLKGMDVEFILTEETGREVIRVLLPDPNGKLPSDKGCQSEFKEQIYADTGINSENNSKRLLN